MTDRLRELSAAGRGDLARRHLPRAPGHRQPGRRCVRDKHVVGVTTNPTIFAEGAGRQRRLRPSSCATWRVRGVDVEEAVRMITTYDVRWACDVLRPAYDASDGVDGRVSIEVDPRLAHDTEKHRRRGPAAVVAGRPAEPVHQDPGDRRRACRRSPQCLAEGISVNVTLIFSLERYGAVMDAFLDGLERARANGHDLSQHRARSRRSSSPGSTPRSTSGWTRSARRRRKALRGKAAIANARLAYQRYEEVFGTDRWQALAAAGAQPQRPLWARPASRTRRTATRMYVDELVAPGVVNTMPEATLDAVADHGDGPRRHGPPRLRPGSRPRCRRWPTVGIDYDDVVESSRTRAWRSSRRPGTSCSSSTKSPSSTRLAAGRTARCSRRGPSGATACGSTRGRAARPTAERRGRAGWSRKDPTLWGAGRRARGRASGSAGSTCREPREALLPQLASCASGCTPRGLDHVVLAGMGGSSLAPEVIARTRGRRR